MTYKLDNRIQNIPSSCWKTISEIDSYNGQWISGARLSPQVLGRLKRSVLITSTGSSTRIEGAVLSDEDIEKLMRGISIQRFPDRDKQEVQGYFELLNNVFDSWRTLRLSEGLIKSFHKELLKYVEKDKLHRGDYKHNENKVLMINQAGESVGVLFDTTPAYFTPMAMHELVEWARKSLQNDKLHPLPVIANFVVEFLKIHPFQDGNGRLSRILSNLLMLQSGYGYMPYISLEKIIEDNKADYYLALRQSQKTFDTEEESIVPWLTFFLETSKKQAELAIQLISGEDVTKLLSITQLAVYQYLKTNQIASPKELSEKLDIPRPTINQIVNRLMQYKLIERIGLGRGTRYRLVTN
jgi:Fic family protein